MARGDLVFRNVEAAPNRARNFYWNGINPAAVHKGPDFLAADTIDVLSADGVTVYSPIGFSTVGIPSFPLGMTVPAAKVLSILGSLVTAVGLNYIASETGSNNAIAGALVDAAGTAVPLAAGLRVTVQLAHTLQAGANTFVFNAVSKNIKSSRNVANNIGTAYAATGMITLQYDGTQWVDVSQ